MGSLKCNFIEYDNSLTAIYVRSISAAFFYAGEFADNKLFRLKGEHCIIIMSSGNSFYCLDYKGDIDVLDMVENILYFALEWITKDHT
jgi:hypothetical protein